MSKKYLWISLFAAAVFSANTAHATGSGPGHHAGPAHGPHFKHPHFKHPHFKHPHFKHPGKPHFGPKVPPPHRPPEKPPVAVPELSAEGALAALALLMGVGTMLMPRARRTPEPDSFGT